MTATAPALTLRITHRDGQPLPAPLPSRTFDLRGGSIGRAPQNDWVLADPERYLSAHHATLYFDEGAFRLVDCSTNGVFLNGGAQPLGREHVAALRDGDRLRLGDYDVEVAITGLPQDGTTLAAVPAAAAAGQALDPLRLLQAGTAPVPGVPARAPYAAADAWLELAPHRDQVLAEGFSRTLDPLALLGAATALGRALPQPAAGSGDGVPALGASFRPPAAAMPVPADWLKSLAVPRAGFTTPGTGAALPATAAVAAPAPVQAASAAPSPRLATTVPADATPDGSRAALALVLQAAGLDPARLPALDAAAARQALQTTGVVLREALSALCELALQRAATRSRQGRALTVIAPRDNNPLKFALRGVAEVLDGFLFDRGNACLGAEAAIAQTLVELKAQHAQEQRALRQRLCEQLDRLDPQALARECPPGRLRLRPAAALRWDLFAARHAELRRALNAQEPSGPARPADRLTPHPLSREEVSHGLA